MDKYDLKIIKAILELYRDRLDYVNRKGISIYEPELLVWDFSIIKDVEIYPDEKGAIYTKFFTYKEDFKPSCMFDLIDYFLENINVELEIIELAILEAIINRYYSDEIEKDEEHEINYLTYHNLEIPDSKFKEAFDVFLEEGNGEYDVEEEDIDYYCDSWILRVYIMSELKAGCFDRIYH